MKNTLKFFALSALGLLVVPFTASAQDKQTLCPMMIEDEIDIEEVVEHRGYTIYMCCTTCTKLWDINPDYYLKVGYELELLPQIQELPEEVAEIELLTQRFCPLRPDCVVSPDSPSIEYEGKKIYFFRERDIARRWERNADELFAEAREAGLLPQFD